MIGKEEQWHEQKTEGISRVSLPLTQSAAEMCIRDRDDCKEKVDETLKALELSDYRERHPASLSGGQKQRVTIGAAIVKGSPVIYFDEPTSGLDYDSMVRVSKLIEQLSSSGVIVFVVSHDVYKRQAAGCGGQSEH